jgi:hypothetical protein
VHYAFKNKLSPLQFMLTLDPSTLPAECQSGWPHTWHCLTCRHRVQCAHYSHLRYLCS